MPTASWPACPGTPIGVAGLGTSFILVIPSLDLVAARAGPKWPPREDPADWATEPFFEQLAAAVLPGGATH